MHGQLYVLVALRPVSIKYEVGGGHRADMGTLRRGKSVANAGNQIPFLDVQPIVSHYNECCRQYSIRKPTVYP